MVDVSGIPNMGFGGGGYFGGSAAGGLPAMSSDQIMASLYGGYSPGQGQQVLNNNFNNFGQQTDYYSALGAAYGRNTGGFGGGGFQGFDMTQPWGGYGSQEGAMAAMNGGWGGGGAGPSTYESPGLSGGGFNSGSAYDWNQMFNPQPVAQTNPWADGLSNQSGGGFRGFDMTQPWGGYGSQAGAMAAMAGGGGGGVNPYAQMYRMPDANPSYFNPGTYAGDQGNYGLPYNGSPQPGDIGFSRQSQMPNLGYNPGMENWFANPGMNANQFQNQFGMGFPNAGTPSQIYPGYGETLTPEDRYTAPHDLFGGASSGYGAGG